MPAKGPEMPPEVQAEVVRLGKQDLSNSEIATIVGWPAWRVSRVRNRNGVGGKRAVLTVVTPELLNEIERRYLAGDGFTMLGREFHVTPTRLKGLLSERGIVFRENDKSQETKDEVLKLHVHSSMFSHEIYTKCGISETTYTDWTRGIERLNRPTQVNPMKGKSLISIWTERYGTDGGQERMAQFRQLCSDNFSGEGNPMYGKPAPQGSGNGWKGWYRDHYFRSLRELSFMMDRDQRNIPWVSGETMSIPYSLDGKLRTYRPDFLCGTVVIELKPQRLIASHSVAAKTEAARLHCAERGLTYEIFDIEIDSAALWTAYKAGLIRFARDYEKRFIAFHEAALGSSCSD